MWFITEILPGVLALTIILVLAVQNLALRKMVQEAQRSLLKKEAIGAALAIVQISQMLEVYAQRIQANEQKAEEPVTKTFSQES